MGAPIINGNKSSRMEIGEIIDSFELDSGEIRYNVLYNKRTISAIPMATNTSFKPRDKVVLMFQDSNVLDTPFIINKYNQKSLEEEKLISKIQKIEKLKDKDSLVYETPNSVIRMDDKKKRVVIGNKNSNNAQIVLDNDNVIIGGVNLTKFIEEVSEKNLKQASDQIISSDRNLNFKTEDGQFKVNSGEAVFLSDNFIIKNKNDMSITTNHVNFSSSFIEFNAITPKGYDLKEKNAFSFFAIMGNYSISLGTGDFNLKAISPLSEFNFLISPLTPFSGVKSSFAGINFSKTETLIGHVFGLTNINLKPSAFSTQVLMGLSKLELDVASFGINLLFGVVSLKLTPASFSVTIAGNKMTLSPSGLTVTTGNILAIAGDVKALGGTYSLMKHKHPTAVPGGPSPPLPG
jgi:hypothetical protein